MTHALSKGLLLGGGYQIGDIKGMGNIDMGVYTTYYENSY
jgi:hypothetical protein